MKCSICKSNNLKFLFKSKDPDNISTKYYSLYECNGCHTISIQPTPSNKELEKFYPTSYYTHKHYGLLNKYFLKLRANKIPKKNSILDIGCGEGSFLKLMKDKGYNCYGLETSAAGLKEAHKKNITIYTDIRRIRRKFDVITLWQVFEHINRPISYLKSIKKLLKKNGFLIISIPNFDSLQSKIGKDIWFHLDLPRHVFHYTPKTIVSLLRKEKLKIVKIEHFLLEYNIFGFVQTILNLFTTKTNLLYKLIRRSSFKNNNLTVALLIIPIIIPIAILLSVLESILEKGGTILVYAKKQN